MADARAILDRWSTLTARRAAWEEHWQDVFDHILPARAPVGRAARAGGKRAEKRFDATATRFMRRLASTLTGLMASPAERWFSLRATGLEGTGEVEAWLDGSADRLYEALHESNFYGEIAETLLDLIGVGTGGLFVDERAIRRPGFNGFVFRNLAVGEYAIDEGPDGIVDTVFRVMEFTARQARIHFRDADLDDDVARDLGKDGPGGGERKWAFVHAVYRRGDPLLGEARRAGDRSIAGADWISVYVDVEHEKIVSKGGFRDRRYFTPRWSKSAGEVWGRGPAMDVLPDVKTLNTIVRYGLEGLILSVYPPWLFPDESLIGRLSLKPGARNVYDPGISGEIRALQGHGDLGAARAKENDLRQAIAQGFLDDVLGLREGGANVTATEVLDRRERRRQLTGPAVARVETELLDPLVETCWTMMFRAGAFGPPPAALSRAGSIEIDFVSPLARARRMASARSLQDAFALIRPLAGAAPGMLDHYDFDRIARDVPDDLGVPRKWMVDEEAVDAARRRRPAPERDAETAA